MKKHHDTARERITTWDGLAEFFGRTKKTVYNWVQRDDRLAKLLFREGWTVFMYKDDAQRYRESMVTPYRRKKRRGA